MRYLFCLLIFVPSQLTQATHPVRRSCYPTYVQPVIVAPYVAPIIQQVEVQRDYYYSIDNSYRDKIFLDAIVGRLATVRDAEEIRRFRAKESYEAPSSRKAPVPVPVPVEDFNTEVPKGLKEAVDAKCIKCHNPSLPERADLSNLAATPPLVRWQAHGLVNAGEMPKGGGTINDATVVAFYNWAKLGSRALTKVRRE